VSKLEKFAYGAAAFATILVPALVMAQALGTPSNPVGGTSIGLTTDIVPLIRSVAQFLIAIALVIAVIFILWGGIMYMAAGSDEAKAGEAKSRITNGIIGAAVVLAVGLILSTLSTIIGNGLKLG
jgi:hypothetical protein